MKKLLLMDGMNMARRFFHGMEKTDMAANSVMIGWVNAHVHLIKTLQPDLVIAVFDEGVCKHRVAIHEGYKAHRLEKPIDFEVQLPPAKELAVALGALMIEPGEYEADDVIANLAVLHVETGGEVWICSSDKDFTCLLCSPRIHIVNHSKGYEEMTIEKATEKWGVHPEKHQDMLALMGDKSDGYPGIPSVGPVTAAKLINQFGSWQAVYKNIGSVDPDSLRNKLVAHREIVERNAKLARLMPLDVQMPTETPAPDLELAGEILRDRGLFTHAKRVSECYSALA